MKIIKGLTILAITLALGSCFDPPEFPSTPHIDFLGIAFKQGGGAIKDSLIVTIEFEDGEGDLGVDAAAPEYKSGDFSAITFFQTDESNKAVPNKIYTDLQTIEHLNKKNERVTSSLNVLQIEDPTKGKLVFPRTRKQSGFGDLPAYHCEFYEDATKGSSYAIEAKNKAVLDATAVVDTLYSKINAIRVATHYVIRDTLYFTWNPNHFNFEVDFLVKEPSNPDADETGFVEYNWNKEFCQQNLDGRFPFLTDSDGAPLAGTIRYGINSHGLKNIFTIKTMKLRIRIRDRAFNTSNVITTQEFTLDSIRI